MSAPTNPGSTGKVWQPPSLLRIASVVAVLVAVALSAWAVRAASVELGSVPGMIAFSLFVFLLPTCGTAWFAFRCKIVETDDGFVLRTMFSERSFAWGEIEQVAPDRSGVRLELKDGTSLITGAIYGFELRSMIGSPRQGKLLAEWIAAQSGAKLGDEVRWQGPVDASVEKDETPVETKPEAEDISDPIQLRR